MKSLGPSYDPTISFKASLSLLLHLNKMKRKRQNPLFENCRLNSHRRRVETKKKEKKRELGSRLNTSLIIKIQLNDNLKILCAGSFGPSWNIGPLQIQVT